MLPPNKRKRHLEAARKSKVEHVRLKKNKTMHQSNNLLDYESVNEELDDHIWVDEEIDEKADSYFEVLLAAARNNNSWKVAAQNTKSITFYLSLTNSLRFNVASTSTYKFLAADVAVQLMETNLVDEAELDNMLEKDSKQIDKGTKEAYKTRCIHTWGNEWLRWQKLPKENRGNVNPKVLKEFVENKVFPSLGIEKKTTISEKTALEWLKKQCIHVSEFLYEPLGRVHLTVEQHLAYSEIPNRYVTETLEVGINHDSYWNVQLLAKQLKQTIDVLEIALP
ncbi:10465_t:CDS:2, partial [Racocetra persica]